MKQLLNCLSLLLPLFVQSQLKIDDVGDNWKLKVQKAIIVIQAHDVEKYDALIGTCTHVGYWTGLFSTSEDSSTILLSTKDISGPSINNVAAALVHESLHLFIKRNGIKLDECDEEFLCYMYELEFLESIPIVEPWLIDHALKMMEYYRPSSLYSSSSQQY
jgi:hypothetical protein